jgi:hypothetical protein
MHQRLPSLTRRSVVGLSFTGVEASYQEALNGSATWHTTANETRWKDPRVVHDEYVASLEQIGQRRNVRVSHIAGPTIQSQQAGVLSFDGRLLCDQVWRQAEVEVRDSHVPMLPKLNRGDTTW